MVDVLSVPDRNSSHEDKDDLYDAPSSQPEVLHEGEIQPDEPPSQAEGDRDTIEEDLREKGLEGDGSDQG